ncbi:dockerin type I domain-containing protein [uncultured Ruminococcus sp.]|uniref:dockerin type I domain-containing protein n=1 Tax=uncultured Ruminococcus sp. TaxID=165186 RepID=UPI0026294321|nr:dockerin type I domain-containing protein [uncultured Ruminococcus sp.]
MKPFMRYVAAGIAAALAVGSLSACPAVSAEGVAYRRGDVNGDEIVSSDDMFFVKQYLVQIRDGEPTTLTQMQMLAADVDLDGEVTMMDMFIIGRYYVFVSIGYDGTEEELWEMAIQEERESPQEDYDLHERVPCDEEVFVEIGTVEVPEYLLRRNYHEVTVPIYVTTMSETGFGRLSFGVSTESELLTLGGDRKGDGQFTWMGYSCTGDRYFEEKTELLTLMFEVSSDARIGDVYPIHYETQSQDGTQKETCYSYEYLMNIVPTDGAVKIIGNTGDLNSDEEVTAADAYEVLLGYSQMSVGAACSLSDGQKIIADVNSDGKIDAADAYYILLYYANQSVGNDISWRELTDTMGA